MEPFTRPRPKFPKRAVITVGMPYGNKSLHFGHIGLALRADTFARFMRDRIGAENVIFVSGTDCYGSPAVESFRRLRESGAISDTTLSDFVARNYAEQKAVFDAYHISFNFYGASAIGPAAPIHAQVSAQFIQQLYDAGMLSKQSAWQFYDEKQGQFLNGRQVIGKCPIEGCQSEKGYADECDLGHQYLPQDLIDPVSMMSGEKPKLMQVENWYFSLENCRELLLAWITDIEKASDTSSFMIKELKEFFKRPEIYVKKEHRAAIENLQKQLPSFEIQGKDTAPSFTMVFESLPDREKACQRLAENAIFYRTGKTLTPFRLTGKLDWGVPCPEIEGLSDRTFYVWPESLWAPISFTKTFLRQSGKPVDSWKTYFCDKDSHVYQFLGEDNIYFYGPAQQAMWLCTQGKSPQYPAPQGQLQPTKIVPIKSILFLDKKASSSGTIKPPSAREFLDHYTPEQFRMHILGMNLGNNNINFSPKCFNPQADDATPDPVLKEGNLLTNVFNRILRTLFYFTQKEFDGYLPFTEISADIKQQCEKAILDYERFMYDKKFHQVINVLDVFVRNINKYWVKEIGNATSQEALQQLTANTAQLCFVANILLHPMAPQETENVATYLGLQKDWYNWQHIFKDIYHCIETPAGHKLKTLYQREDFFTKHPSQLEALAARNDETR